METDVLGEWPHWLRRQEVEVEVTHKHKCSHLGGHTDGKAGRGWITLESWHKSPQEVDNLTQKVS